MTTFRDGLGLPLTDDEIAQMEGDEAWKEVIGYTMGRDAGEVEREHFDRRNIRRHYGASGAA